MCLQCVGPPLAHFNVRLRLARLTVVHPKPKAASRFQAGTVALRAIFQETFPFGARSTPPKVTLS